MKTTFISLLSLLVIGAILFAQQLKEPTNATDFAQLDQDLRAIRPLLSKRPVEFEDVTALEKSLAAQINKIYLDINTRLDNGQGNITPEWQAYIERLGNAIKPYQSEVVEAALRTVGDDLPQGFQLKRPGSYLYQILDFAKPDAELDAELRAGIDQFPRARWKIYRKLFELRLLTEEDVKEMELWGESIQDPKEKMRWAEEISFYGSEAGLDILAPLLKIPFDSSDAKNEQNEPEMSKSMMKYAPAFNAVLNLGSKAKRLEPDIAKIEEVVSKFYLENFGEEKSKRFLTCFSLMNKALKAEASPVLGSARNGSGLLYRPGFVNEEKDQNPSSPNASPKAAEPLKQATERNRVPAQAVIPQSKSKAFWVVAGLIAILASAWFMMRKIAK